MRTPTEELGPYIVIHLSLISSLRKNHRGAMCSVRALYVLLAAI